MSCILPIISLSRFFNRYCQSGGYYKQDMQAFADWGYNYIKVDVNFAPERTETAYKKEFTEVAKAIQKMGRPIVFSLLCNQGDRNYQNWAPYIGNSWRVGPDIDHMPKQKKQWEGVIHEMDLKYFDSTTIRMKKIVKNKTWELKSDSSALTSTRTDHILRA